VHKTPPTDRRLSTHHSNGMTGSPCTCAPLGCTALLPPSGPARSNTCHPAIHDKSQHHGAGEQRAAASGRRTLPSGGRLLDPPEGCCLEKFEPLMEWWGPVLHHLPAHCWLTGSPGAGPRAGALCHDDTLRDQSVPGGRVILMAGPESGAYGPSLYRDDTFRLSVKFSEGYPLEPPEVRSQRA